jgi:putative aminopeptidase FrvX
MHTPVEVCHLKDLENSAKLLAEFVQQLGERTNLYSLIGTFIVKRPLSAIR